MPGANHHRGADRLAVPAGETDEEVAAAEERQALAAQPVWSGAVLPETVELPPERAARLASRPEPRARTQAQLQQALPEPLASEPEEARASELEPQQEVLEPRALPRLELGRGSEGSAVRALAQRVCVVPLSPPLPLLRGPPRRRIQHRLLPAGVA
ncbi:MAG TPA: hypothetical protein VL128_05240 [Candidatus Eisenbacteria bacterium]|nr:hypothetical protein [Candidatus Eisenbacteria bacterium]